MAKVVKDLHFDAEKELWEKDRGTIKLITDNQTMAGVLGGKALLEEANLEIQFREATRLEAA